MTIQSASATITTPAPASPSSLLSQIVDFENGELPYDGEIEFFQGLIDTGLAWRLQGFYGRTAANLIEAGLCFEPGDEVADFAA